MRNCGNQQVVNASSNVCMFSPASQRWKKRGGRSLEASREIRLIGSVERKMFSFGWRYSASDDLRSFLWCWLK